MGIFGNIFIPIHVRGKIDTVDELWDLIRKGKTSLLGELIEDEPEIVHLRSKDGRGPLFWAYAANQDSTVNMLLEAGAWPRARDAEGSLPHEMSASGKGGDDDGDDDLFDDFDDNEEYEVTDDDEDDEDDFSAYDAANFDPAKAVWANTPDTTQMWHLINENNIEQLEQWIDAEPNIVHIRAEDGRGPLWWAYEYDRPEMVDILINAGAREDLVDNGGMVPKDME